MEFFCHSTAAEKLFFAVRLDFKNQFELAIVFLPRVAVELETVSIPSTRYLFLHADLNLQNIGCIFFLPDKHKMGIF